MDKQKIYDHSKACYDQHVDRWRENAKFCSQFEMKSFEDFRNIGIGKAILLVANGYSLELGIETIKKHQHNVDIMACDKSLGHLIANGIKPKYCLVCDASVNYEKYLKPYEDELQDTILISSVLANTEWITNGNWKDKYFFVNIDILESEKEFQELSGCKNLVVAGTNVSNMMIVLCTQSTNENRQSLMAYDKIILTGFDYSWLPEGNYYAFDRLAGGKHNYMRHVYALNQSGDILYTSNNLITSAEWAKAYIDRFILPVVQTYKDGILNLERTGDLSTEMQYKFRSKDQKTVTEKIKLQASLEAQLSKVKTELMNIAREHHYAALR